MSFNGFPPSGLDLMIENRLMDSQEFYESHKADIKKIRHPEFDGRQFREEIRYVIKKGHKP